MIVYPAIDILGGKAVRLAQGDYGAKTVYDDDPLEAAKRWIDAGGRALHIVDLDGAKTGKQANLSQVERIAGTLNVPIQLGGGLRSMQAVKAALDAGVSRVILGTAAFRDVDFLDAAVGAYGERVVVSVDGRGGKFAAAGWTEQTDIPVADAVTQMGDRGVRRYVYSSIERDGMLTGPDIEGTKAIAEVVRGSFIYSGGISKLEDFEALAALRQVNLSGVITGKAIYEGKFDVGEAQAILDRYAKR